MGYIFIHEFTQSGKQYEGATLSPGRVNGKHYHDRIDINLESPVINSVSQGLERMKVYIDPYRYNAKGPLWKGECHGYNNERTLRLFAALCIVSWL